MTYHVLTVVPRKEAEAALKIESMGMEAIVPIQEVWRRGGGGPKRIFRVALVPSYVFIRGDNFPIYAIRQLRDLNGRPLVTGYIAYPGGAPKPLAPALVDRLEAIAPKVGSAMYHHSFKPGDRVRRGSIEGVMLDYTATGHARVLTAMLGREHVCIVPVNKLDAAE